MVEVEDLNEIKDIEEIEEIISDFDYPIFFQAEASDIALLIQDCHWYIWLYLVWILVFVLTIFLLILVDFSSNMKYITEADNLYFRVLKLKWEHVTHIPRLEFGWTTFPCIVLFLIGFKSIYTLYVMDAPKGVSTVLKAFGRQWFWQYEVVELTRTPRRRGFVYQSLKRVLLPTWKFKGRILTWPSRSRGGKLFERALTPSRHAYRASNIHSFDSYLAVANKQFDIADRRLLKVDSLVSLVNYTPVRVLVVGMDVLHSYAVPSMGLKIDAIPGRLNSMDIFIKRHGLYSGQCSELCGQGHGYMPIGIYVSNID